MIVYVICGFAAGTSAAGILLLWDSHRVIMGAYTALELRVRDLENAQRVYDERGIK